LYLVTGIDAALDANTLGNQVLTETMRGTMFRQNWQRCQLLA
jgi:hypothetical protein